MSDGRVLKMNRLYGNVYKTKGGIITQIWCPKHGWMIPENFYVSNKPNGSALKVCAVCRNEKYVPGTKIKYRFQEEIYTDGPGGLGMVCNACNVWKPLTSFCIQRRREFHNRRQRQCMVCSSKASDRYVYLRRMRETLGESSSEYIFAKNEKRKDYIQAMCWMFGILSGGCLQPKKEFQIQRILPGMFTDAGPKQEFLDALEAAVQIVHKRQKWYNTVVLRPVQEALVRTRFLSKKHTARY